MKPRFLLALVAPVLATAADAPTTFHFDFSSAPAATAVYSKQTGYGFDLGTKPTPAAWGVTGDKPFFFSVALPEGNYRVTAHLGDSTAACVTTIKAESRRLMIERAATAAGQRSDV